MQKTTIECLKESFPFSNSKRVYGGEFNWENVTKVTADGDKKIMLIA